eukprot:GHVT01041466.1.p1 GENE.GHVT01041466.1~~GHVT01041466.1.p1  ORF type:complete len:331 (+),score=41.99 GHVT01041466.1:3898-4890(+)
MDRFGHFAVAGVAVCSNALRACTAGGKNVRCQCHNCDYLCMGSSGALPVGLFLSALSPPGSTEQRYREMVAECRLSPEEVSGFVAEAIIAEEVSSGSADVSGRQPNHTHTDTRDLGSLEPASNHGEMSAGGDRGKASGKKACWSRKLGLLPALGNETRTHSPEGFRPGPRVSTVGSSRRRASQASRFASVYDRHDRARLAGGLPAIYTVAFVDHVKTWVPILFEMRSSELYAPLLNRDWQDFTHTDLEILEKEDPMERYVDAPKAQIRSSKQLGREAEEELEDFDGEDSDEENDDDNDDYTSEEDDESEEGEDGDPDNLYPIENTEKRHD